MLKILCIGPQWRGSNAGGLFRALSRTGNLISIIDENYYLNLSNRDKKVKVIDRLFRRWHIQEFNKAILKEATSFTPQIILIYKGAFVLPDTINYLKSKNFKVVNFYPDVSFRTHGSLLAKTLPLFDHIFTTKTFGIKDMREQLNINNATFIPHGFDPDIHKKLDISAFDNSNFACDVSFIGGWSEKKENLLKSLKTALPNIDLKIWGSRWEHCKSNTLRSSIQHKGIYGDLYTIGILSSKINLGILHEKVQGASSGDLITSRTFHIPGAGGFMLHEKTDEIDIYFNDRSEIGTFSNEEELIKQVQFYLANPKERELRAEAAYKRSITEHSLDHRAKLVIKHLNAKLND